MKNAVIFDFDGVVINSLFVQRLAFYSSYASVGGEGEPSFEEFLNHSGDSLENICQKMNLPVEMIPIYRKISKENIDKIMIHDGIVTLLKKLTSKGIVCCLCTGKERDRVLEILKALSLDKYFTMLVCSDDVTHPKPHPESLHVIIHKLNLEKSTSVMIGDAPNDIICAKAAGVKSIGVTWGDASLELLKEQQPDFLVSSTEELYTAIMTSLKKAS